MRNKIFTCFVLFMYCTLASHKAAFPGNWLSPVQLTHNTTSDQVPVINADGTRIVYYSNDDGDDDIYILEYSNGSWQPSQKLTFNTTPDTMPSINAYGDKIAYIGGGQGERSIYFIEHHDGIWKAPERISDSRYNDYFPSISAGGGKIVFQSKDAQGNRFIRLIEQNDGVWDEPVTLPASTSNNMFPVINADGTKIAFYGEKDGYRHIYFVEYKEAQWSDPLKLTGGDEQNIQPSINASGSSIVYYWTGEDFLPHVQPEAMAEIRLIEYKQECWQLPITIANSPLYEFDPTISGEGNRVVYAESNPGHPDTVYVVEEEDGNWVPPENLTRNVISGFRPYINGAGDKIVCYGTRAMDADYEIYLLSHDLSAGGILGNVATEPERQPLESALVFAEPGGYITITDEKGNYELCVPPGNYTVTAHVNCFESSAATNVAVQTGEITEQDITLFPGNCFPAVPTNPSPPSGASNQDVISLLQWECFDPDLDPLTYDVLLGEETEHHIQLGIASSNQATTFYQTKPLNFATTYYWQIIARDDRGGEQEGPLWHFTTHECPLSLLAEGDDEEITLLRNFRDKILRKTPQGQELIKLYYQWSPAIVKAIQEDKELKNSLRNTVDDILFLIKSKSIRTD